MPALSTDARDQLEAPITLPEIQLALGHTKSGKAPGPDGLTLQYYKLLLPALGEHLAKLLNSISEGGTLHINTLQAQITVIPKDGKDPTYCGSYRPISLLNTDLKLFTKVIATRLQLHLPHLIHLSQLERQGTTLPRIDFTLFGHH